MKFCREWKTRSNAITSKALTKYVINYKRWKKLTKRETNGFKLYNLLDREVACADKVFRTSIDAHRHPLRHMYWCIRYPHTSSQTFIEQLYEFSILNRTCTYKICKRLDKRFKTSMFMQWFLHSAQQQYCLLGRNHKTKWLEICVKGTDVIDECPVCLDEKCKWVLTSCGHVVCYDCVLGMLMLKSNCDQKGTLYNLVSNYEYTMYDACKCPVCRCRTAFRKYITIKH